MNYSSIYRTSLADGTGWRVVLFVSGCSHHCKECHNAETWDPKFGTEFTDATKETLFSYVTDQIEGLTLSGGDPLYKDNIDTVMQICKEFKERFPDKNIWLYTGYLYKDIKDWEILKYIDVLVDGPFKIEQKDTTLAFRGSLNQRIIDVHTGTMLQLDTEEYRKPIIKRRRKKK